MTDFDDFDSLDTDSSKFKYWKLSDSLGLGIAAALILGIYPNDLKYSWDPDTDICFAYLDEKRWAGTHKDFEAVLYAIRDAVIQSKIEAIETNPLCDRRTQVSVKSLKEWLAKKGRYPSFFFTTTEKEVVEQLPAYLDTNHPRYAPELAAAVRAWEAVTDSGKTSTKQALKKWLKKNNSFGISETGIERIAVVANWDSKGGAPSSDS